MNVLLVTLDTTRADRLGCYGNERIETPHLDALAAEGVRFDRAFTPVPSTLPSHCSIMSGLYPARHGVHDNGIYRLDDEVGTLAERFLAGGYRTGAFVSAFVLDEQFGLGRGFQVYDDDVDLPLFEQNPEDIAAAEMDPDRKKWFLQMVSPYQRRADAVTRAATDWLASGDEPFFLWVHYFDPHMDYQPPAPWDTRYDPEYAGELDGSSETWFRVKAERGWSSIRDVPRTEVDHMIARYDGEISFMDQWIGELFGSVREAGGWEETLVVVVADHGEAFGEHGQTWEHNQNVSDVVMRVPMIVKRPQGRDAGQVGNRLVRTIDLAPTILAEAGLDAWADIQGVPLFPLSELERTPRSREILLQALREQQALETNTSWLGLRDEDYKLAVFFRGDVIAGQALYHVASDPEERNRVEQSFPELVQRWSDRTVELYAGMKSAAGEGSFRGMDEMTSDALRKLGYVE